MALARVKTWIANEKLTAADLNAEFNNILNNALALISPLTGNLNVNNNQLLSVRIENLGSSPSAGQAGRLVYQTAENQVQVDDGSAIRRVPTIASVTTGDLIYASGANQWARRAIGSAGQVLLVSGGVPTWAAVSQSGATGCRVFHSANQSTTNNTATIMAFNSERWDVGTMHDTVTNNSRITMTTAGKYYYFANVSWEANATGYRQMEVLLNGATVIASDRRAAISVETNQTVSGVHNFALNDYIELRMLQNSGGALNLLTQAQISPEFGAIIIST